MNKRKPLTWADVLQWALNGITEGMEQAAVGASPKRDLPSADAVFRRLAKKYHPDRSPRDAEVMKDINELHQAFRRDAKTR